MHDHIGAERERLLPHGREESIVRGHQRTGRMGGIGDGADIHDPQQRVARRLDPDEIRLRSAERRPARAPRRSRLIDEVDRELALRVQRCEQPISPAIAIVGRENACALREAWRG